MKSFNIDSCLQEIYSKPLEGTNNPIIGITCNSKDEDYFIRQKYVEQVEKGGGVPMLLSPTDNFDIIVSQLNMIDGIIFTGGGDYNPLWLGEEPSPELHSINPERDRHELMTCRLAYNRNIPMLGICRGMQTMAIALGGHVCQDIVSLQNNGKIRPAIKHCQDAPKTEFTHSVSITEGSTLYNIYNEERILVNSFHHQIVDITGKKFRVIAKSNDGLIEAMESTEFRSMLAVQWHPEQLGSEGLKIFSWLTKEAEIFRKAKDLHKQILTIDSHCDTPMFFPQNIDFLSRDSRILYDLHKMDEGHIDAVNMVCYLPQPKFGQPWKSPLNDPMQTSTQDGALSPKEYTDLIFDKIEEICSKQPKRLSIAKTPQEVYRDKRFGRHSIMIGIENGLALEHELKNVEYFKNRGITYITLCHNGDNDLCDSARGCQTHGGVSSFGKKVIEEMNRRGIIVDLSHAAESSFYDALKYSNKPIVCSHSNCRALCDHPRNLTDDQMRKLSEAGGVMQLTMYHGFLSPTTTLQAFADGRNADREKNISISGDKRGATIEDFLNHLDYAIKIMGIDHVGIGTDFDGDGGIIGCASASELINITMHLIRRGFSNRDIEKIWGKNWLRVMAENQSMPPTPKGRKASNPEGE